MAAADSIWIAGSGTWNFDTAGNWDGGAIQNAQTGHMAIAPTDCIVTGNMDQSAVDPAAFHIGEKWKGQLGTAASPLKWGTATLIRINAPYAQGICLWPNACTTMYVEDCGSKADSCHLVNGTVTDLYIGGGKSVKIGASATVTNLHVFGGARVIIESAATLSTLVENDGGLIYNDATLPATVRQYSGTFYHQGTASGEGSAGTITASGGTFYLDCKAGTITAIDVYRGAVVDGARTNYENTVTNCSVRAGGVLRMNMETIHTNAPVGYGGVYAGPGSLDQRLPSPPMMPA